MSDAERPRKLAKVNHVATGEVEVIDIDESEINDKNAMTDDIAAAVAPAEAAASQQASSDAAAPTEIAPSQATAAAANGSTSNGTSTAAAAGASVPRPKLISSSFVYVDLPNISEFLRCSVCSLPLYHPQQHKACSNVYCSACLEHTDPNTSTTTSQCPECKTPARATHLVAPARQLVGMLDALRIKCGSCDIEMARKDYENHYVFNCPQPCPNASLGCTVQQSRASLADQHRNTCEFAPVNCDAESYGCEWTGRREALAAHKTTCALTIAVPHLEKMKSEYQSQLFNKVQQIAFLGGVRKVLDAQLASERERRVTSGNNTTLWKVDSIIDALDTDDVWLVARVTRINMSTKQYYIHYVDWDASWNEWIPCNSPRLAPGGTRTTPGDVEKHVRKVMLRVSAPPADASEEDQVDYANRIVAAVLEDKPVNAAAESHTTVDQSAAAASASQTTGKKRKP